MMGRKPTRREVQAAADLFCDRDFVTEGERRELFQHIREFFDNEISLVDVAAALAPDDEADGRKK
jgi:hypothetical protein